MVQSLSTNLESMSCMSLCGSPDALRDSPGDAPHNSPGLPQSPTQVATFQQISTALQTPPPGPQPHVQHGAAPCQVTPGSLPVTPNRARQMDLERLANALTTSSRAKNYQGSRNTLPPSLLATSRPQTQDVPHSPAPPHPPPLDVPHSLGPQKSTPLCQSHPATNVHATGCPFSQHAMAGPPQSLLEDRGFTCMPGAFQETRWNHLIPTPCRPTPPGSAKTEKFMQR